MYYLPTGCTDLKADGHFMGGKKHLKTFEFSTETREI